MRIKASKGRVLALAAACAALALAAGLSAARCAAVHEPQEGEQPAQEGQAQDEPASRLTQRQQEAAAAAGEEAAELAALLSSNTWTASRGAASIAFDGEAWTESRDGRTAQRTYAICGVESAESVEEGANGERARVTTSSATLMLDDGTYAILRLRASDAAGAGGPGASVASEAFELCASYVRDRAATGLEVEGLNDEAAMVLHGTADQLQRTLEDHCALAYPTASRATWDRTLEANWNKGIVHLGFTLDNAARTRVGVDYDLAAGAYMVSGGAL